MTPYEEKDWKSILIYEVLLPKRLEYLGKLQDVLQTIFDEEKIRQVPAIRAALSADGESAPQHDWLAQVARVFTGYSMYEVDGRYVDLRSGSRSDERTMIIRLVLHDRDSDEGMSPEFQRLVDSAVRWLLGNRLAEELGTEAEIWIIRYDQAQIKIWEKRTT
jgi:hypothetical protein